MANTADDSDTGSDATRTEKSSSSIFSHSFSTTWRKALVSLPRIVPSAVTSHYLGIDGPRPFVLKLPSSPPREHSIPVHIFLQLPSNGGDSPSLGSAPASRARSANSSPNPRSRRRHHRHGSRANTPVSASRPSSIHGDTLTPTSAEWDHRRSIDRRYEYDSDPSTPTTTTPASASASSAAVTAARRSFEHRGSAVGSPLASFSSTSTSSLAPRPGPKPDQRQHRRPTLSLPVMVDFHGGSFILGSPSEQAPFCAYMARALASTSASSSAPATLGSGCVVISVDYRLGPYSRFPAANEDADDVVRAVMEPDSPAGRVLREDIRQKVEASGWSSGAVHSDGRPRREWVDLDTTRVAVSGFSSGGNLALNCVVDSPADPNRGGEDWLAVVPRAHRAPVPVVLFYPSFDARLLPDERPRPEGLDPPTGFFARWKIEDQLMPKYLPVERRGDIRASPGLGSVRHGLHPKARVFLVLPELDSLSDQSAKWVDKVRDEGRGEDLQVENVKGEMHGWTQFPDSWIKSDESRRKKYESFEKAAQFVGRWWFGTQERAGGLTFGEFAEKGR